MHPRAWGTTVPSSLVLLINSSWKWMAELLYQRAQSPLRCYSTITILYYCSTKCKSWIRFHFIHSCCLIIWLLWTAKLKPILFISKSGIAGHPVVCHCPRPAAQWDRMDVWTDCQLPVQRASRGPPGGHASLWLAKRVQRHHPNLGAAVQIPWGLCSSFFC